MYLISIITLSIRMLQSDWSM